MSACSGCVSPQRVARRSWQQSRPCRIPPRRNRTPKVSQGAGRLTPKCPIRMRQKSQPRVPMRCADFADSRRRYTQSLVLPSTKQFPEAAAIKRERANKSQRCNSELRLASCVFGRQPTLIAVARRPRPKAKAAARRRLDEAADRMAKQLLGIAESAESEAVKFAAVS